jgi:hypothetical protein
MLPRAEDQQVMYYSNEILSKALPKWGPYVSLSIAVVGFLATFTPIFLIDVSFTAIVSINS